MPKKKKPVYKFGWSFGGTEPDSISSSDANIRFATPEKAISDLVKWITGKAGTEAPVFRHGEEAPFQIIRLSFQHELWYNISSERR